MSEKQPLNSREYEAYQAAVNLELYHAYCGLILSTSGDPKWMTWFRQESPRWIWRCSGDVSQYFERVNLRYPGEVLERFEEHIGTETRNLAALSLALARMKPILTESMFVGAQLQNFLAKLRRLAPGNLYLEGALTLWEDGAEKKRAMLRALASQEHRTTQDALFVVSLFENAEDGVAALREQLPALLGERRTLPFSANIGVYEWLLLYCETAFAACRGKKERILRVLLKLPYQFLKPGSREYDVMKSAGYSDEEIAFANSRMLWSHAISDHLNVDGITAEKIAARACAVLLNSPEGIGSDACDYVGWLLNRYRRLRIAYQGNESLWRAICDELHPCHPQTILWMCRNVREKFAYRFDAFDARYDVLARKLPAKTYAELFTDQMLRSRADIPIRRWLRRYRRLTGRDYETYYGEYHTNGSRSFQMLTERKGLCLWDFFTRAKEQALVYLENYVMTVPSRRCYRFLRYLLSRYDCVQLQKFFGDRFRLHSRMIDFSQSHYHDEVRLNVFRPFLTDGEQRQVIEWMDESVFRTSPEQYPKYVRAMLESRQTASLFCRQNLALILRRMIDGGLLKRYAAEALKQTYFAPEELAEEQRREEEAKEQQARRERAIEMENKRKTLEKDFDGTFSSLLKYSGRFYYGEDRRQALQLAFDRMKLVVQTDGGEVNDRNLGDCLELCGRALRDAAAPREDVVEMIANMIGGKAA